MPSKRYQKHINCPKCHTRHSYKSKFCYNCGALLTISDSLPESKKPNSFEEVFDEILHFIFHLNKNLFLSLKDLIIKPGETLKTYANKEGIIKSAISYFLVSLTLYILLNHLIFERFDFKYQLCGSFDSHAAPLIFIVLLFIMAIIGFITLGWRGFNGTRNNDYDFWQVFVISSYIYGTNFFLAPLIVTLCNFFQKNLDDFFPASKNDPITMGIITDIPLALFMIYMLLMLIIKTKPFKFRTLRFILFLLFSYCYYFFMYRHIHVLEKPIHDFFNPTQIEKPHSE